MSALNHVTFVAGVEKLMEVYHNRPNFADADAQEDARQRLTHVRNELARAKLIPKNVEMFGI